MKKENLTPKKGKVPASVTIAVIFISIYILLLIITGIFQQIEYGNVNRSVIFTIMILLWTWVAVGVAKGNRKVWQVGQVLFIMVLLIFLKIVFDGVKTNGKQFITGAAILLGVYYGTLIVAFIVLQFRSSRKYMGLECPKCQSKKVKSKDLLYSKAVCRTCGHIWK